MSIRLAAFRLVKNGRLLIRHIHKTQQKKITYDVVDGVPSKPVGKGIAAEIRSGGRLSLVQHVTSQARRVVVDAVLNRVTHTLASDLRRKVTRRLLFGDSTPFFALVGVSIASGAGILTKDDELEGVCWEIRDAVCRCQSQRQRCQVSNEQVERIGLDDVELGPALAKGCSAVVYAARWKDEMGSSCTGGALSQSTDPPSIFEYPLAVKMMFNYDAESNAASILHAMHKETVPAWFRATDVAQVIDFGMGERFKVLPPHANIVEMYRVFADRIPYLPGSMALYPDALPSRINPTGSGRNMSLFLIMKRYECSVKDFVSRGVPSLRVSQLMFAQLLEAVAHMNIHNVAHRDLKSDNLLLDLSEGDDMCPILAVCDFGCCLADTHHGLMLPFHSPHTDRGGNAALMAPEVACAQAGPFVSINYSKTDMWAAGTIAYEMFGMSNPFTNTEGGLKNRTYKDEELPALPSHVPAPLQALVAAILSRNPAKRPSPELAATICQLMLWAPSEWLRPDQTRTPSSNEVLQWLLSLTTKVLCEGNTNFSGRGRRTLPEYQLITSLLARVKLSQVRQALAWLQQHLE